MIQDMNNFSSQGSETKELINILEKCEAHKASGLGFWNWTQLLLAYSFTLNKIGNTKKACEILDKFFNRTKIASKAREKLLERFQNVRA